MQIIVETGQSVILHIEPMVPKDGEIFIVHYEGPSVQIGDLVTFHFRVDGSTTYEAPSGEQFTVPEVTAINLSVD